MSPRRPRVLLLDRAGWHTTRNLVVPKNMTLVFLPSRAPELNPVENIWQYLRQTWLSNRVFETYEAIIEAACEAWRSLLAQPTPSPQSATAAGLTSVRNEGRWYQATVTALFRSARACCHARFAALKSGITSSESINPAPPASASILSLRRPDRSSEETSCPRRTTVRQELGLFLLSNPQDEVHEAFLDQSSEIGGIRTTCRGRRR